MKDTEPKIWWHWQALSKRGIREGRAWLYTPVSNAHVEWHWFSNRYSIGVNLGGSGDDSILLSFCIGLLSFYVGVTFPWGGRLRKMLPDEGRQIQISYYDHTLRLGLWEREHEWRSKDPWWVRGVRLDVKDLLFGSNKYANEEIRWPERITIELDGRAYCGTASFERRRWKRPRWPWAMVRESVWIDMDPRDGLPHAGKGENSWDCGDDALCGWGHEGLSVEEAIGHGITEVLKRRKGYGHARACA